MKQYCKKPVVIEAIQFDGTNGADIMAAVKLSGRNCTMQEHGTPALVISTLEGVMQANVGDYVIKGVQGKFYPCKPDIFAQTYEVVEEQHV